MAADPTIRVAQASVLATGLTAQTLAAVEAVKEAGE